MSTQNSLHRKYKKKKPTPAFWVLVCIVVLALSLALMAILGAFGKGEEVNSSFADSTFVSSEMPAIVETSTSSDNSTSTPTPTSTSSKENSSKTSSKTSSKVSVNVSSKTSSTTSNIVANLPNGDWRLIIANKQYPLPESYKINVAYASGNYRLDSRIINEYKQMIADAKKDGISLQIISGFRTYAGQTTLFNNKVNQYLNQGHSREKAKELAAQYVAPPGTSEHLTGLAVDLISPDWYSYNSNLNSNFEKTPQFAWLYANCAKYGFVLRYPKDKEAITGYSYEPWHYRYVGVEHAKIIMEQKICLEEYVANLG